MAKKNSEECAETATVEVDPTQAETVLEELIWHTESRKIKDLKEHEKNPRKITKDQMEKLKQSLKSFNYVETIVINLDNTILAGHMRIKALKALGRGKEEIEVRAPNRQLTPKEAEEYLIRSNKNSGEWDWERLANEWEIPDLFNWGFTEDELQVKDPEKLEASDDGYEEEIPDKPKTQPGDVYDLGRHRLICGSATVYGDIEKVLELERIDLVITDPPYNVAYKGGTKEKLTIKNDNLSNEEFENLLRDFYVNAFVFMKEGAGIYVFHADSEGEKFRRYFRESNLKLTQCLIWLKNSLVLGRQDYQWQHEPVLFGGKEYSDHDPVLYGWKEGEKHRWFNNRKQTTLLKFDRPQRNAEHPTMKPIPLIGYLINNSSKPEDLVFDFFLGSGSTLIAAEQLNRRCFGCELDPKYCDVIVDRYKKYKLQRNEVCEILLNGEAYA
jgi:DNA modification methylase